MRMIPNNILWVITLSKWKESVKFRHAAKKVKKKTTKSRISQKWCIVRSKVCSIFVRLVARNPMVFISGRYDQYFLSYDRKCNLTFDLWRAFRPEVEFKTRHMGGKPFTRCTFWSLFGVNRPSSFRDMAVQSFWSLDLWWPWSLTYEN